MKVNKEFIKKLYENGGNFYVSIDGLKNICIMDENMQMVGICADDLNQALFYLVKHMMDLIHMSTNKTFVKNFDEIELAFEELGFKIVKISDEDEFTYLYQLQQVPAVLKYDPSNRIAFDDKIDMSIDECRIIARYEASRINSDKLLDAVSNKRLTFDSIVETIRGNLNIPMDMACFDVANDELIIAIDLLKHQMFVCIYVAPAGDGLYIPYGIEILNN